MQDLYILAPAGLAVATSLWMWHAARNHRKASKKKNKLLYIDIEIKDSIKKSVYRSNAEKPIENIFDLDKALQEAIESNKIKLNTKL